MSAMRLVRGMRSQSSSSSTTIASGAKVTLRASAAHGYRFDGWSGACRSLHACTLHPKAAVKVTATFRKTHS
jgi:hypothetical protein